MRRKLSHPFVSLRGAAFNQPGRRLFGDLSLGMDVFYNIPSIDRLTGRINAGPGAVESLLAGLEGMGERIASAFSSTSDPELTQKCSGCSIEEREKGWISPLIP